MFGSKKIQELEAQVRQLTEKLTRETAEKTDLAQKLESAKARIAEVEAELHDFDLENLKEKAKTTIAEYEGLKDLYARKNKEFDDSKEEAEQTFARDQALQRHNLENEIRDNRQANQDYVANTVKTFGESYNYYLSQIKTLMDALGNVAAKTGEALFSGDNGDLKTRFGSQMRDMLKSGAEALRGDGGDRLFIGGTEDEPVEEPVEEAIEEPVEEFVEDVEEVVEDAAEDAEEAVEEVVEEAEEAVEEAADSEDDDPEEGVYEDAVL